ncbi:hypothetical protein CSIRO_4226 [Bradyrhizobiaceae bacterium SG-6C]|jgi:type III secretion system FlhB-like substrate exporter|nr:hypothetical protein CSIRO_4226 [Bradyrhizobiaceae bacterium SG-6C]
MKRSGGPNVDRLALPNVELSEKIPAELYKGVAAIFFL